MTHSSDHCNPNVSIICEDILSGAVAPYLDGHQRLLMVLSLQGFNYPSFTHKPSVGGQLLDVEGESYLLIRTVDCWNPIFEQLVGHQVVYQEHPEITHIVKVDQHGDYRIAKADHMYSSRQCPNSYQIDLDDWSPLSEHGPEYDPLTF